jgi:pimeloyl-ACP methyl ester carboxylesterase
MTQRSAESDRPNPVRRFEAVETRPPLEAPSPNLLLLEQRVLFEVGALAASMPWLRAMGRGDRHPVLVLPGFMGDDLSTIALRTAIRSWGYWAHGWRLGSNLGPTRDLLDGARARLEAIHGRHGRPVSLVGWSGGGIMARHLARESPAQVRQVITLGAPLQMRSVDRSAASMLVELVRSRFDADFQRLPDYCHGTLPVPSTSIYSRTDGVVRWQTCLDVADDRHENVEVIASHVGLGFNPAALFVIADRLRQPEGQWRAFRRHPVLRWTFPRPGTWDPDRFEGPYRAVVPSQ